MKNSIVWLLFFCTQMGMGQTMDAYYQGILTAKRALIADQFPEAIQHYYHTFETAPFIFSRDTYNALELACHLKNNEKTNYFTIKCLQQGVPFELLAEGTLLSDFRKTNYWNFIERQKDFYRSKYLQSIDMEMRSRVNAMFEADQAMREKAYKSRFNPFKKRKINAAWEALNAEQVIQIVALTENHGFPGEQLIGIDESQMHPKIQSNRLTAGMPIVILIHHYSQPNPSYNELLFEEVKKGKLWNEHYAVLNDFQQKYGKGKYGFFVPYSKRFGGIAKPEKTNQARADIGLLTIEEEMALSSKNILTPFWRQLY